MPRAQQQPLMYFSSLELENVRCFGERQVLELTDDKGRPAQWTLLLGDNGVGKTTLLECLAWMRPVPAGGGPNAIEPALNNEENTVLSSLLRVGPEVKVGLKATLSLDQSLGGTKKGRVQKIKTSISMVGKHGQLHDLTAYRHSIKNPAFLDLPIFAYGAARHMGISNLDKSELSDPLASLFSSATELYDAEEILLNLDYLATKIRKTRDEKRLQQVKRLLATILPDISDEESINILGPKVLGHPDEPSGVRFDTPYGPVPLSRLSLGYKTTLAWALDLAMRLYKHYPNSPNPLAEPAIVLVDEIDLHLHPRWQRQIMAYLTQHFSNTQFIATAHSPLMVQSATNANLNANLVVLQQRDGQVDIENRPLFVEGWRVDQILTSELFGVPARSPRIQGLIEEQCKLLDKSTRTSSDEQRLRELDEELDNLPTASHEDNEAMDIIRQAATLIKAQESREL